MAHSTLNRPFYQFDFKVELSQNEGMGGWGLRSLNYKQVFGIIALFSTTFVAGCKGISLQGTASSCEANTAQLIVYEGAIKRNCGCAEGQGTFNQPASFNCTVPINTVMYFYFVGISSTHQVFINSYPPTQPISPESTIKTAGVVMNLSGTFNFSDSSNGVGGTIIVTP